MKSSNLSEWRLCAKVQEGVDFIEQKRELWGWKIASVCLAPCTLDVVNTQKRWYMVFLGASQILTDYKGYYWNANFPAQNISAHLDLGDYYPFSINFNRAAMTVFHTLRK